MSSSSVARAAHSSSSRQHSITLYPFQREALASIWQAARRAKELSAETGGSSRALRACVVQPTGSGKTVEILALVRELAARWGWRTLVIEPTRELVRQTVKRASEFIPDRKTIALTRKTREFSECDLVVATGASLHKTALSEIDPSQFDLVVVDEAHHAASDTYEEILSHFSCVRLMLGFTATYRRGDDISIASSEYFSSVIVYNTIGQLTTGGYLIPANGFYKHTGLVLENVPIRRGQYDEKKLAHAVNIPERNAMIVDAWEERAAGRMSLVFTVNISHAQEVAATFNSRGIAAAAVWGKMDDREYARVMEQFRGGQIKVLANSKLLCEGFDEKQISACIIARPSTEAAAKVLGPQMIGRALRLDPESGKKDAVIIELVDKAIYSGARNSQDRSLNLTSLLASGYGVSQKTIEDGPGHLHEKARRERVEEGWRERLKMLEGLRSVEAVEETFDIIERVSQVSDYAWIPLGASTYYMSIGGGSFVEVVREHDGYYEVRAVEDKELKFIGSGSTLKETMAVADAWVLRHGLNFNLQVRSRPWRKLEPRPGQIFKAHKLTGLSQDFLKGLTRGQLSDLITSAEALLLPFEEIKPAAEKNFPDAAIGGADKRFHMWQFGSNRSTA